MESGEQVGFVGLREFGEAREVELLCALHPSWWKRGLALEACHSALRFGFCELGLPLIFAGTDPPNTRSRALIERLRMPFHSRRTLHGREAVYHALEVESFSA